MKLKNDPYFPVVALAMIAALLLSLLNPAAPTAATQSHPANTLTAAATATTHGE